MGALFCALKCVNTGEAPQRHTNLPTAYKQAVQKYIQNQETEDLISNQISIVEYYDPFKKWLETNSRKKDKKKK